MRYLAVLFTVFMLAATAPAAAQEQSAATAQPAPAADAPAPVPAADAGAQPAEQPQEEEQAPISDLRAQQVQDDNVDNLHKELGATTDENGTEDPANCTARDVAAAMKPPSVFARAYQNGDQVSGNPSADGAIYAQMMKNADSNSDRVAKARNFAQCNLAFEKMNDTCTDQSQPCGACEGAVKKYSESCGYVRVNVPTMGVNPGLKGRDVPITKIPYTPGRAGSQ